ncbi:MAG: S8 family serine peptidase [Actinomycetes bacterium]
MPRVLAGLTATVIAISAGIAAAPTAVADPAVADPQAPAGAPAGSGDEVRLVVRLEARAGFAGEVAAARALGAEPAVREPRLDAFSLDVPAGEADAVRRDLGERAGVDTVQVAHRRTLADVPNDPQWSSQSTYMSAVHAPGAWGLSQGRASVRVAVIDTGVATGHPDLIGKVVGQYNAVTGTSSVRDAMGHGTSVASVAAARTGNGVGVAGSGYRTSVLAVKVADSNGTLRSDAIASGIRWAADHGADVINMSFGGSATDWLERDAVAYAQSKGVLLVASAGNAGTSDLHYPAALPGVLSVGATSASGTSRPSWSSYGRWVDLAAPGAGIRAAVPGGRYGTVSGTSFSAPLVAGEAALLLAVQPTATAAQLTATLTAATTGARLGFAQGLVDFRSAVRRIART